MLKAQGALHHDKEEAYEEIVLRDSCRPWRDFADGQRLHGRSG